MCEAIIETQPEYFKRYSRKFRYLISYSYPTLPLDNFSIAQHCSGRFCNFSPSKHWHVLLFHEPEEHEEESNHPSYAVPCPYSAFRLLIKTGCTNVLYKGELFEKLAKAVEYHIKYPDTAPKEIVLKKKLPKIKALVNNVTQTTHITRHFLERILAVANGKHGTAFNTIVDAFNSGCGFIDTYEHGQRLRFELDVSGAQCTCTECCPI